MDPARLPGDLFVKLLEINLSPRQIIQLRAVSTTWNTILRAPDVCRRFLRVFYPQCREIRLDMLRHSIGQLPSIPHNLRVEVECRHQQNKDWGVIFLEVVRRYHNLRNGTPQEYLKMAMPPLLDQTHINDCPSGCDHSFKILPPPPGVEGRICDVCKYKRCRWGDEFYWSNFPTRNRYLYHRKTTEFDRPDPLWWYSQEDGLLVYPAAYNVPSKRPLGWDILDPKAKFHVEKTPLVDHWRVNDTYYDSTPGRIRGVYDMRRDWSTFSYQLFDPQTGEHFPVPFDVRKKVIRRVRLSHGVLVIEWAELAGFVLRELPLTGKHFVTAFDVVRTPVTPDRNAPYIRRVKKGPEEWKVPRQNYNTWTWKVKLRAQWELLGLEPELPYKDKGPCLETRVCFSAHTDTHYAVYTLQDQVKSHYSGGYTANLRVWDISTTPPLLVRHMPNHHITRLDNREQRLDRTWQELDIRNIALDKHNVYLIREYHFHLRGNDTIYEHRRTGRMYTGHTVETRGIPVIPFPPGSIPHPDPPVQDPGPQPIRSWPNPYRDGIPSDTKNPVHGPTWFDECPRTYIKNDTRRVETNHCRHTHPTVPTEEAEPTFTPERGSLLYPARLPSTLLPSLRQTPFPWDQSDAASNPLQPRTFPGNAPCWRHDLHPYLTAAAATDYGAGVRFVARDGYYWLRDGVRDVITVDISGSDSYDHRDKEPVGLEDEEGSVVDLSWERGLPPREMPGGEVEIGVDDLWGNMMGRMTLAGDERFVIGQDGGCNVTLVRF